jgi:hypothetical protein
MSTLLLGFTALVLFSRLGANAQSSLNYAYVGGIPLRTPSECPAGSVTGQITVQQNCCGADQTFVKDEGSVCCPDSTDCYKKVVAAPKVISFAHLSSSPPYQLLTSHAGAMLTFVLFLSVRIPHGNCAVEMMEASAVRRIGSAGLSLLL